jgi:poly(3-hydroxybutyrate) depolymerase
MLVRSVLLCIAVAIPTVVQDKVTRETFSSSGATREYYLYVPPARDQAAEAPLLILLHGSGRDGKTLVDPWKDLAKKEGIILAGPNATNRQEWELRKDGPYFIADLVDAIRVGHRIDLRRIYLFGHSAGAIQGLMLGLLESEYFAAVAVHAGALPPTSFDLIGMADRKIPFAIWVGTNDSFFPVRDVEATKAVMEAKGLTVALKTITNHTHNYYQRSGEINEEAWAFLKDRKLERNPKFKEYDMR